MKLFKLLKKETSNIKKISSQKLEKNQLEKVIGGGDGDTATDPDAVTPIRGKNVKLGKSPGGDIL